MVAVELWGEVVGFWVFLKVEPKGFANGLDVECVREREKE